MLLTQKALTEGSRALVYWLAQLVDTSSHGPAQEAAQAGALLSLLTPIAKAFCTETGFEVTSLGVQVFGGHGYIREHGMEQLLRDSRIAMLYEGTTGIQSLDLLGRKVMGSQGKLLAHVTGLIHRFCTTHDGHSAMAEFIEPLAALNCQWGELTTAIGTRARRDPEEIGAASVDYTLYAGYVVLAYLWARMARVALQALAQDDAGEAGFYRAKLTTARFYYARLLPRATAHARAAEAGADTLMAMPERDFWY